MDGPNNTVSRVFLGFAHSCPGLVYTLQIFTGSIMQLDININRHAKENKMLRSVKSIYGYAISATDGEIGKVHDIFFDDEKWAVRYLVADTGTWLPGKKVLLFPIALAQPDWERHVVPVGLTVGRVSNSPTTDDDKPVSKQHEIELHKYFNWSPYWSPTGLPYGSVVPPVALMHMEEAADQDDSGDPHLRSTREVTGYHIQAIDGEIGHVDDFILDDEGWFIRYLVVDTRNWLPGKKVLIPPHWLKDVRWSEKKVAGDLSQKEVKGAPEYDPSKPINRAYELQYYDYYGRPAYF